MAWLHAVYFLDQNRGWVAGSNGTLLQTNDGGISWTKLRVPKDDLRDVYFSSEQDGWLLAQRDPLRVKEDERSSYLLNTKDGGVTWQPVVLNTEDVNTRFTRMLFTDQQHGWVFGETGLIFATSDGGARWLPQRSPSRHLLLGAAFGNAGRGLIVGAGATIMQSENGSSWSLPAVFSRESTRLNAAAMVGQFAWAAGSGGQIFATADGGRSWYRQRSNVD